MPANARERLRHASVLRFIRTLHTAVWAVLVACILGIFVCAHAERFDVALILISIVMIEVIVLVANGMRCPLTDVAARHTDSRTANFDIYLPHWLAQHNQAIFGTLYVLGLAYTLVTWLLCCARDAD